MLAIFHPPQLFLRHLNNKADLIHYLTLDLAQTICWLQMSPGGYFTKKKLKNMFICKNCQIKYIFLENNNLL